MSTYPILHSNRPIGTLESTADGLYTVFTARCEAVAPSLRLSVWGADAHAYLGLMLPEHGGLYLRKRLTRLACAGLPRPILYAAEEAAEPSEPSGWQPAPDGTLRRFEQGRELVAIPRERVRARDVPRRLLREIAGREYLVFPL